MLLADIRAYLKYRKIASLEEVALHFDISRDSADFALNYWVKRDKVNVMGASCNTSCNRCDTQATQYQWREGQELPIQWK